MKSSPHKRSHLLIQEPPLQVLPSLCAAIGLERAIIVQQLHYWLENPKAKGVQKEGYKWIENSYSDWHDNFPFWSIVTIKRHFIVLEKMGLVIGKQFNLQDRDAKKAYRLDYDAIAELDGINLIRSDRIKLIRRMVSKRYHVKRNPESSKTESEEDDGATSDYKQKLENRCELIASLYRRTVMRTEDTQVAIPPLMKQIIVNDAKTYEDESWYEPAFMAMVKNCKSPTYTYVQAMWESWSKNGFGSGHPGYKKNGNGRKTNTPPDEEADTFMQDREAAQKEFEKEQ